jgi:hypothetical protein
MQIYSGLYINLVSKTRLYMNLHQNRSIRFVSRPLEIILNTPQVLSIPLSELREPNSRF